MEAGQAPRGTGGAPVNQLIHAWRKRAVELVTITLDHEIDHKTELKGRGLRIIYLPRGRGPWTGWWFYPQARRRIGDLLQELKPSLIHAHWPVYALPALAYSRDLTLVNLHDHPRNCLRYQGWKRLPYFWASHRVYQRAKYIAAVSHYTADYVRAYSEAEIDVVSNILNNNVFTGTKSKPIRGDAVKICAIGDDSRLKNIEMVCAAVKELKEQRPALCVTLDIIGGGLDESKAGKLWMKKYALRGCLRAHGIISHDATLKILREATCLVHPSREESFGYPVAEAMANHVPVIAGKGVGEMDYLLGQDERGWLCNINASSSIARALVSELECAEDLRTKKINAAYTFIKELCGEDRVINAYLMYFTEILNRRGSSEAL